MAFSGKGIIFVGPNLIFFKRSRSKRVLNSIIQIMDMLMQISLWLVCESHAREFVIIFSSSKA